MRILVAKSAALALASAFGIIVTTGTAYAQAVPEQPRFTKQAFDANWAPLTGPVTAGQVINYVLSYNPGASSLGAVSIEDILGSNLAFLSPTNSSIIAPPGWTWSPGPGTSPSVPYSAGNREVYSHPGFGPGTSFVVNVPVSEIAPAPVGQAAGDGFYPIPIPALSRIFGIFHHKPEGAANPGRITCWELLNLTKCAGYDDKRLDPADLLATPQTVRTVVLGTRIYYPSARWDSTATKTFYGIGCWDAAGAGAPCPFIPLVPGNPSAGPSQGAPQITQGSTLGAIIAGVVADPANSNRLFMYAVDKVYCIDVSAAPASCSGWTSPTLSGGTTPRELDMIAGEGAPARLFVHYGVTSPTATAVNKSTVACLNASDGARCNGWPSTDAHAPVTGYYGVVSPVPDSNGATTAVCLHPYMLSSGATNGELECFDASSGGTPTTSVAAFKTAMKTAAVFTAFRMPNIANNKQRVLYARYNTSVVSCFDFATSTLCASGNFAPAWTTSYLDYGYAVDPAAPDRCLLGLGHAGRVWRFTNGGGFDTSGCVKRVEVKFDLNKSFFCGKKPTDAKWNAIVFRQPPPTQLVPGTVTVNPTTNAITTTGTTFNLVDSAGVSLLPQPIPYTGASVYQFTTPVSATDNNQVTVQFSPVYSPGPPLNGYQFELTFTADVDPQICYQAGVKECGQPVTNTAVLNATGRERSVRLTANVDLGTATGRRCPETAGLLKVCKVAGPGVAVGTPYTFTVGSSTLTVPAGPAPGGTCVIGPTFPVGSNVAVVETPIPPGDTVSGITVSLPSQLVGTPNLAGGSVDVTIGTGVTEVTFIDKRTGFLEICKQGDVTGIFRFTVNPGGLGPFAVPAGACSPAIEVVAGEVLISELPTEGARMADCTTLPAGRQKGRCNFETQTSTVTVVPGNFSTMTIAVITNRRR